MNKTTNEKKIVHNVLKSGYEHLVPIEEDIVNVVRDTFSEVASEVKQGNKVLLKNFGTMELKERQPRPRYDTGLKAVVTTPPEPKILFTQSPNVFREGGEDEKN